MTKIDELNMKVELMGKGISSILEDGENKSILMQLWRSVNLAAQDLYAKEKETH